MNAEVNIEETQISTTSRHIMPCQWFVMPRL